MIYKPYGLCYWKQKSKPVDGKNILQIINQHLNVFVSGAQDIYFAVASSWPHGSAEVHLPPPLVGAQELLKKAERLGQKLKNILFKVVY